MWSLEEQSAKSLQLCLNLWDPMDCSPPGSSVHEILPARILEWVENSLILLLSDLGKVRNFGTNFERSKSCLWGKHSILERMEWMLLLVAWLGGCSLHVVPWESPLCPPHPPPHPSQASRDDSLIVRPHGVTERWPGQEGSLLASDARVGLYA